MKGDLIEREAAEAVRIEEIAARIVAATEGPWLLQEGETPFYNDIDGRSCGGWGNDLFTVYFTFEYDEGDGHMVKDYVDLTAELSEGNADFIAHSREDVPWLLGQLKAASTRYAELERAARYAKDVIRLVLTFPNACDGEEQLKRLADDIEIALANLKAGDPA